MRLQSSDSTTSAALTAAVSRLGWCEALRAALGDGYRVVWRDAGDVARVTLTMSGSLPISEQQVTISAQPSAVSCSAGTPTHVQLESADGSRWARLDRLVALVDSTGAPLAPVSGAGFAWVDALVVRPPRALSALPAWLQDAPLLTWVSLPDTRMDALPLQTSIGSKVGICAYSGGYLRGARLGVQGGGHTDYGGNEVLECDLTADAPAWEIVGAGTPAAQQAGSVLYYSDGKPSSRHTYGKVHWSETQQRVFLFGGYTMYTTGPVNSPHCDGWSPSTGEWDAGSGAVWPDLVTPPAEVASPSDQQIVKDGADNFWMVHTGTGDLYRADAATMVWTMQTTSPPGGAIGNMPVCYDSARNRIVRTRQQYNTTPVSWLLDGYTTGAPSSMTHTYSGDPATISALTAITAGSMVYCADLDAYLVLKFADSTLTIYRIDAESWEVSVLAVSGTPAAPASGWSARQNYYGRFQYVPELGVVAITHAADADVHYFRTR